MENLVKQLKDYFENNPKELLEVEYKEIESNCSGPSVEEWLKANNLIK